MDARSGGRAGSFGALLVGAIDDGAMRWVGQVGTGFNHQMLDRMMDQLTPLVREDPRSTTRHCARSRVRFVEPELVCEVEYLEITKSSGKMRAPSFRGLRPDKTPDECVLEPPAFDKVRRKR